MMDFHEGLGAGLVCLLVDGGGLTLQILLRARGSPAGGTCADWLLAGQGKSDHYHKCPFESVRLCHMQIQNCHLRSTVRMNNG